MKSSYVYSGCYGKSKETPERGPSEVKSIGRIPDQIRLLTALSDRPRWLGSQIVVEETVWFQNLLTATI